MGETRKWVTMGDVAARAGVGKITVSRALRTPSKVSPATLEKVRAAVAELGYVLDETAGALSSQRSRIVGALVSTLEDSVFASTVRGLTEGLSEGGLQLLLSATQYDPETEAALIPTILGRRPEALVLTSADHTPAARDMLNRAGIPVLELWELPDHPVHTAVGFSNRAAGAAITRHLVETGRRNIVFLKVDRTHDARGALRMAGFLNESAGLPGSQTHHVPEAPGATAPDYGAQGLREILERLPETDAVICTSDIIASGVLCEAQRMGLEVPGRLAIAGFGDFDISGDSGLALTTLKIDGYAIGRRAAELILAPGAMEPLRIDMGFTLVRRATT
ncbi:LacI family DNA-binding transcriptional regulator [Salipiger mucosus]|uniref:Gluconate utilization system Gnt-I transcriptional repressor n=1 Tax=Salipiger mucosus DSM 16094 TaxID=1123237 RepID=S9RXH6_9RHOB|nr:LacI family DNA-binding transcriptional regulator [Salipiger mucosus]EPX78684.1 Gluconate utilization system Gnt-I transcriptional repressor [Salipiger mucosus DSM 16094]